MSNIGWKFQSTRPVKDATIWALWLAMVIGVSIHASREGRDRNYVRQTELAAISIHASREGRDNLLADLLPYLKFQSTRPVKDATIEEAGLHFFVQVSIHASREGRDLIDQHTQDRDQGFNPRVP